jgi:hypothetical protein
MIALDFTAMLKEQEAVQLQAAGVVAWFEH